MKICIIGLGFVGSAMYDSFILKGLQKNINIFCYDKYKNGGIGDINDSLNCDIVFLALPTPFNNSTSSYELNSIYECCDYLSKNNYNGIIIIKSTIIPNTIYQLENTFSNLEFIHNPEFLTARTAFDDFNNQKHIVLGKGFRCSIDKLEKVKFFYSQYFPDAKINDCSCLESECMKIFCNCFYAVKVQFFTELYLLCEKNSCDFNKIKNMMLENNWINSMHTNIPGPDGQISYGGLCFPKDTNALNEYMKKLDTPNQVLESCINERNILRNDHNNCN